MEHYNNDKIDKINSGEIKNMTKDGHPQYHMFFGKRSFNELLDMMVTSPGNQFHGCEINMPETAIFAGGKATRFVKTNKEGFL